MTLLPIAQLGNITGIRVESKARAQPLPYSLEREIYSSLRINRDYLREQSLEIFPKQ